MSIFSRIFGAKKPPAQEQEQISPQLEQVIAQFAASYEQPCLRLKPQPGSAGPFSTKLGGAPYLPPGFPYPCSTKAGDEGQPLHLLAQFNFNDLPQLPGWPNQGMLQFFIADDDLLGLDLKDNRSQNGWRVIYHPQVDFSLTQADLLPPPHEDENNYFPIKGEYLLVAEPEIMPMSCDDYRFGESFNNLYQPALGRAWQACTNAEQELVCQRFSAWGHHLGGYPAFTQEDPRTVSNAECSRLLLQLDSDADLGITWGDSGLANFFISEEDFLARDFSRVLYNWDCY